MFVLILTNEKLFISFTDKSISSNTSDNVSTDISESFLDDGKREETEQKLNKASSNKPHKPEETKLNLKFANCYIFIHRS